MMCPQFSASESDWTIGRLLSWTSEYLTRNGVEDARLASEVLLAHATQRRRIDLYAHFDDVPGTEQVARFRALVKDAAAHRPIAYLVGEKEFFSLAFTVTPDVLIPRPETETLVEVVVDHAQRAGWSAPRVLDVGTGSGCIAIAILKQLAGATAVATDVSAAALEVARGNAVRHGVTARLTVVEADRLTLPQGMVPAEGFDVIVSNPPYIAREAVDRLYAPGREYEPRIALTDDGDGLSFYRSMTTDAPALLARSGVVVVEVADNQAPAVVETMGKTGVFVPRGAWKDRVVGQDRVLMFAPRE